MRRRHYRPLVRHALPHPLKDDRPTHSSPPRASAGHMVRGQQEARRNGPIQDRSSSTTDNASSLRRRRRRCRSYSCRRLTEFDELTLARKIIEMRTEIKDNEGEKLAMSLLHPGAYLHKAHGPRSLISSPCLRSRVYTLAFPTET